MVGEKRTKPCSNCKRSKVKCMYQDSLPCERCLRLGQASDCQLAPKLPSLKLRSIDHTTISTRPPQMEQISRPFNSFSASSPELIRTQPPQYVTPQSNYNQDQIWKSQMELRIDSFDNKISSILNILTANTNPINSHLNQIGSPEQEELKRKSLLENSETKRAKIERSDDFRDSLLSLKDAHELFEYFDNHITPQLFGFEICKIDVDSVWEASPILICAICSIAAIHHPNEILSSKAEPLQKHLQQLCPNLVLKGIPRDEAEGFNTILALVLCSFWLLDSQMFTGLALQLARQFGLDSPQKESKKGNISRKDRIRLWYLLYVLDGQQSLAFNRTPLVSLTEYSVSHSREILLSDNPKLLRGKAKKDEDQRSMQNSLGIGEKPETYGSKFTDLKLVSQVEYSQAISEAFSGNSWELLAPSQYGIPCRSNLELDRWMVSWTVLLAAESNLSVWSSKSTLIYYNFAKMHINSKALRKLTTNNKNSSVMFPTWNDEVKSITKPTPPQPVEHDSDDSDNEEEFVEDTIEANGDVETNLAFNSAQNILNLVLEDTDILNNLKYVPVHVHIMFYYAALILMNMSSPGSNADSNQDIDSIIERVKKIRLLQKSINSNLPTDREFASQLLLHFDKIVDEKLRDLRCLFRESKCILASKKQDLENKVSQLLFTNAKDKSFELLHYETLPETSSSSKERIHAWPGANHGHP